MVGKRSGILKFYVISLVAVFALLVGSTQAFADSRELEEIRNAIKAKGARWHADETSMSRLTMEERKMRLGLKNDDLAAITGETSVPAPVATMEGAPLGLDWRNKDGVIYVSSIKNQGSCGSCWAFAVTAALESQEMIAAAGSQVDLSEQILVSCSGAGSCSGGSSSSASNYIRDVGLPLESCFNYTATNNSCTNACANWQATTYKVNGWHAASTSSTPAVRVQDIKNALYTYGPVVASFYVYNDFFSYRSGIYSYTTGSYAGAHAVLVVGYDDVNQCFIVKNSWGTGWGEAGYFMIAYGEVGGTSKFAYSALAYDGYGDNPPPPPPACTYSLSSAGKNFKAAGGSASFSVSTQSGCNWSATSNASWVRITSGSSGGGNGTVFYTVDANTGSSRSAEIKIQGLTYKITQQQPRK